MPQPSVDNFSYNGPTLSTAPNRRSASPAAPQPQPQLAVPVPNTMASRETTGRSDLNTLVQGENDNSTLVNGSGTGRSMTGGTSAVPLLVLIPDNKKYPQVERIVSGIIKIGRYMGNQEAENEEAFTFKSKVISRHHAEVWAVGNDIFLRDTKSQSGTFLNAMRLSEAGRESKPYKIKTGDIVQFGVDYKDARDDNSRCITVRIEVRVVNVTPDGQIVPDNVVDATMAGGGNGNGGETLVNGSNSNNTENMTLVGGGQNGASSNQGGGEATLVGAGGQGPARKEQTLVNYKQPQAPMVDPQMPRRTPTNFAPQVGPQGPSQMPTGTQFRPRMSPGPGPIPMDGNGPVNQMSSSSSQQLGYPQSLPNSLPMGMTMNMGPMGTPPGPGMRPTSMMAPVVGRPMRPPMNQ